MIRPPLKTLDDLPSPLMLFVSAVTLMATTRKMLSGLGQHLGDAEWHTLLEDLALFLHDKAIIGLRSPWVRRVAVPVVRAQQALEARESTQQEKGRTAIEILGQCADLNVRETCIAWIKGTHHV